MSGRIPNLGSRAQDRKDEYYTPPDVMCVVHRFFDGPPELDPASCPAANVIVQARRTYTAEENGLRAPWQAASVWLNPPFSQNDRFVERLYHTYRDGLVGEALLLQPVAMDTRRWQRYLRLYPFCAWTRRIRFINGDRNANYAAAILYLGTRVDRFVAIFGHHGLCYQPALNATGKSRLQLPLDAAS